MRVKIFLLSTLILNVVGQFDSDPRYGRFPTEYDDYFDQVPSPQGQENYNQENNNQQWQQQNNFSPTTQRSRQPGEISQASNYHLFTFIHNSQTQILIENLRIFF